MAKKKKAIVKVSPLDQVPAHLQKVQDTGTGDLTSYMVPSRIKVVQRQSDDALLEEFNVGDVILSPDNVRIAEMEVDNKGRPTGENEGFLFTPIFFFPEWCVWNPIQMRGKSPAVRERSFDPNSEIARKAKNPALRTEPHPSEKDLVIRYVEHLNFVCSIEGVEGYPILTFSRGDHKLGTRFCALIKQRKAALFGCVFQAHVVQQSNDMGSWYSLEIANPDGDISPWVDDEELFAEYEKEYNTFKELHRDAKIAPAYEDDTEVAEPDDDNDDSAAF